MPEESSSAWSSPTVTETVLLVLEPVIVSRKLIKVEVINLVDILEQKNLQEDLTQVQGLIPTQVQLRQA
jgi:hypothetical protein